MDTMTISLAVGLIVSLIVTEVFGMTAGGMIVPGYFAISVHRPLDLLLTVLVAGVTFGLVRLLSHHLIIYGRRRIVLMLLFGFLIGTAVRCFGSWQAGAELTDTTCACVIGFIIPGLIALWFDRQGVTGTLGSLATSTVLVRLILIIVGLEIVQ
jgi:poly-gamma-glutamate biosynthesis protein PgsC/CapC